MLSITCLLLKRRWVKKQINKTNVCVLFLTWTLAHVRYNNVFAIAVVIIVVVQLLFWIVSTPLYYHYTHTLTHTTEPMKATQQIYAVIKIVCSPSVSFTWNEHFDWILSIRTKIEFRNILWLFHTWMTSTWSTPTQNNRSIAVDTLTLVL